MTPTDKPTQVGGLLPLPELPEATAWTYRFIDLRPNASGTWGRWLFATEQPHRPVHPHEFEVEPLFTASQMHTYAQANVQALEARLVALEKDAAEGDYVIQQMGRLLAEIAVIVNGPQPPSTRWSYHDLPAKIRDLKESKA
jgi:hypothetical protein